MQARPGVVLLIFYILLLGMTMYYCQLGYEIPSNIWLVSNTQRTKSDTLYSILLIQNLT